MGWRPQLWGAGGLLHPVVALGGGPLPVALPAPPGTDIAAYPDAAAVFRAGSDVALALATRMVEWTSCVIFEPNEERLQAEQSFTSLTGRRGLVWAAIAPGVADLTGLRHLGIVCGYQLFEANLDRPADRAILVREHLLRDERQLILSRHPSDAIGAPQTTVRASRPFFVFAERWPGSDDLGEVQSIASGSQSLTLPGVSGEIKLRIEPPPAPAVVPIEVSVFQRDSAFEAVVERRLQIRVDSRFPLTDVPCHASLEIEDVLLAYGADRLASLPMTIPASSTLFVPLYDDSVRAKLLASGRGLLTLTIGRSVSVHVHLQRAPAAVEWNGERPTLIGTAAATTLASATARSPHRFAPVGAATVPVRGAAAYGLLLDDGRIVDPVLVLTSQIFNWDDISASFGADVGSRRLFDGGRGIAELARARVTWARGLGTSLAALGAKAGVVRQFDEPLLIDLCGRVWLEAEHATQSGATTDPFLALWRMALDRKLITVPESAGANEVEAFASAFAGQARRHDPEWPGSNIEPAEGAMDDALNAAFSEALLALHAGGQLLDVEDDFDFGSPHEDWTAAAEEAIAYIQRPRLMSLIAPREGARVLGCKSYNGLTIPELAEDLAAWTQAWALPRARLSVEDAGCALLLWLSPAACDDADGTVRIIARDSFAARAVRYAALRLGA